MHALLETEYWFGEEKRSARFKPICHQLSQLLLHTNSCIIFYFNSSQRPKVYQFDLLSTATLTTAPEICVHVVVMLTSLHLHEKDK